MSTPKVNYAGEFKLEAIELLSPSGVAIDIRAQVDQITLYEDLFSPFMSGNVIMLDTIDLTSMMTNSGTDLLRLSIYTPTMSKENRITKYFHIYKLSDRVVVNQRSQSYILHFISTDSIIESSYKISKKFSNKAEDNIEYILRKYIQSSVPLDAESTRSNVNYVSNYWGGIKNIQYNCDMAVSSDSSPSMLFYETRRGYSFKSLVGLSLQEPYMYFDGNDLVSKIKTSPQMMGDTTKDLDTDYNTILKLDTNSYYDYIEDKSNGAMNSRLFSHDFTTKRIVDKTFDVSKDQRNRANPTTIYNSDVIKNSYIGSNGVVAMTVNRHLRVFDGVVDTTDFDIKQRRVSIMRQFQQHKIEITVFGRTDYTVGQCVNVNIDKSRLFSAEDISGNVKDPMLSGNYVVSAICHRFTGEGKHESVLELIRDSIGKE